MPALEAILSTLTPMSNPPTPTHLSRGSHGNCHHIPHLYKHMTYQLRQMAWSAGMGHSIIHILQLCVRQTERGHTAWCCTTVTSCRWPINTFPVGNYSQHSDQNHSSLSYMCTETMSVIYKINISVTYYYLIFF